MAALPKGIQLIEETCICPECGKATLNAQTKVKMKHSANALSIDIEIVTWVVSCWMCGFGYSKAEQDAEANA